MSLIIQNKDVKEGYDKDGNIINRSVTESTQLIKKNTEGNFIKIYDEGMKLLRSVSHTAICLLLEITQFMDYADINDLAGGMTIKINAADRARIQSNLQISRSKYFKEMRTLQDANLIKKLEGGYYQMNPNVIGKGLYEYKPSMKMGGIKDLRDTWNSGLKQKKVDVAHEGAEIIAGLQGEIDRLGAEIKKACAKNDEEEVKELKKEQQFYLDEIKKIDSEAYEKAVEYVIKVNTETTDEEEQETQTVQKKKTGKKKQSRQKKQVEKIEQAEQETQAEQTAQMEQDKRTKEDEFIQLTNEFFLNIDDNDPFGLFNQD